MQCISIAAGYNRAALYIASSPTSQLLVWQLKHCIALGILVYYINVNTLRHTLPSTAAYLSAASYMAVISID